MTTENHVLLVDLSSVFWVNYAVGGGEGADFALNRTIGRVHAFARSYPHVAVCADLRAKTWRHDLAPLYKANRESKPEEAYAQLRNTIAHLRAGGFPVWSADGFEADDVIASATAQARARGFKVTIASADKDLRQLVSEDVSVLSTREDAKLWGPEEVQKEYGVAPALLGDWLAITGDTSDNVPGFPGIGPKGATALLGRFGSLEGVIAAARADEALTIWNLRMSAGEAIEEVGPKPVIPDPPIKPAAKKSILEHADQARLSRRLVGLREDVVIPFDEVLRDRVEKPAKVSSGAEFQPQAEDQLEEAEAAPASAPRAVEAKDAAPAPAEIAPTESPKTSDAEFTDAPQTVAIVQHVEWRHTLEPRTLRDAWQVARHLHESRMFAHLNNTGGIFAAALLARAHGIETMKVLMPGMLHNIKGRIAMSAQLIVGLVLRSGKAEYFELASSSATKAVYVTKRIGGRREVEFEYTIEEARAAGLLAPTKLGEPSQYIKRPKTMLRHRCETELARAVYPDVVGGLYTPEELGAEVEIDREAA